MKNRIFITLLALGIITASVKAQVMPSPDAASLIKNASVPVNLYTGVASVNVPLYSVVANNGAQVPISLSYAAQGIKVSEVAGVAGLGWHLQAGGSITRVMRGQPDEQAFFTDYVSHGNMLATEINGSKAYDREKDLFFLSYPGSGGKFIFSGDFKTWKNSQGGGTLTYDQVETLPMSDLKIEFKYDSDLSTSWVVTDMYGNKYYFGANSSAREITTTNSRLEGVGYDPADEDQFISSWHLTKIEYANQPASEAIDFWYSGTLITDEQKGEEKRLTEHTGTNTYTLHGYENVRYFQTKITTKQIGTINFPKGSVVFTYGERNDLSNGRALENIKVKDHLSVVVNDIDLSHSYFDASDSFMENGTLGTCSDEECKRLKLESITYNGQKIREFDYANDKDFHASGYDRYELPPRDSYYYDHWGYYNGPFNGPAAYVSHASNQSPTLAGLSRWSTQYCKANILTKVTFPAGGYTEFSYGYNIKNGGAKIERVKAFDENGSIVSDISYTYDVNDENDAIEPIYIVPLATDNNGHEYSDFTFTRPPSVVFDLNGTTSGYTEMKVKDEINGSYSSHFFLNKDDYPVQKALKYRFYIDLGGNNGGIDYTYPFQYENRPPFTSHTLEDYVRGLEDKVYTYDEGGMPISAVQNTYSQSPAQAAVKNSVVRFDAKDTEQGESEYWYMVGEYSIKNRYVWLDKTVTSTYESDGALLAETTTEYSYHATHKTLPSSTWSYRSDAGSAEKFNSKSFTYYPSDYSSVEIIHDQSVINDMISNNMIGIPLKTESQILLPEYNGTYKVSGASITEFDEFSSMIMPFETHALEIENPIAINSYNASDFSSLGNRSYNADGLVSSEFGTNGLTTNYTYDTEGYLLTTSVTPGGGLTSRATTYTYNPLVGIATVTDPDGRTISNTYDSQNRLHLVKDQDDNIVKRYRYNYASNDGLSGDLKWTGTNYIGNTITFFLDDFYPYGGSELTDVKWNINGTEQPGTGTNGTKTASFSTAATHDVKVTLINPEYDEPVNMTSSITIRDELYTGDINGANSFNACFYNSSSSVAFKSLIGTKAVCYNGSGIGLTYDWSYKLGSGSWINFGSNALVQFPNNLLQYAGSYTIRVIATDECGNTYTDDTHSFNITDTGCPN